jgi:hypothetical protein
VAASAFIEKHGKQAHEECLARDRAREDAKWLARQTEVEKAREAKCLAAQQVSSSSNAM